MGGGGGEQVKPDIPDILKPIVNRGYGMIDQFQGRKTNPLAWQMSPLEMQSQTYMSNAMSPGGMIPQTSGFISNVLSPQYLDLNNNPHLKQYMDFGQNQFQSALGRSMDELASRFGMAGHTGTSSAFGSAGTNLARGALSDYSGQVSGVLGNLFNQGRGQQLQALGMAGMPLSMASLAGQAGGLPRSLLQGQEAAQLNLDQLPFSMITQLLGGTPVANPAFGPGDQTGQNVMGGMAAAAALAQAIAAFM